MVGLIASPKTLLGKSSIGFGLYVLHTRGVGPASLGRVHSIGTVWKRIYGELSANVVRQWTQSFVWMSAHKSQVKCVSLCLTMSNGGGNGLITLSQLCSWPFCVFCVCVWLPVCLTPGCRDEKGEIAVIMASYVQQKHQREVICWVYLISGDNETNSSCLDVWAGRRAKPQFLPKNQSFLLQHYFFFIFSCENNH